MEALNRSKVSVILQKGNKKQKRITEIRIRGSRWSFTPCQLASRLLLTNAIRQGQASLSSCFFPSLMLSPVDRGWTRLLKSWPRPRRSAGLRSCAARAPGLIQWALKKKSSEKNLLQSDSWMPAFLTIKAVMNLNPAITLPAHPKCGCVKMLIDPTPLPAERETDDKA